MKQPFRTVALFYTIMNLAKHGYWSFFGAFGLVYLTDVLRVAPGLAGAIMFASLLFDALIDPAAGSALEWLRSRQKDYQPVVIGGAAASALCMWGFFNTHSLGFGLAAAVGAMLAFRMAFTVYDLSDNALAARITASPDERTSLSAFRKAAAALAGMATGATAGFAVSDPIAARTNLPTLAAIVSLASFVLAVSGYRALRGLDRAAEPFSTAPIGERLRALFRSKDALVLAGLALAEGASTPILVGGFIYFARASTGDAAWAGVATVLLAVTQIAALPLWTWSAKRFGKRNALVASHALTAIACAAFAVASAVSPTAALAVVGAIGVSIAGVSTMRWSLAPDLIDAASRRGVRIETSLIGLVSGAVQIGAGVAAGAMGAILAINGYAATDPTALDPVRLALWLSVPVAIAHVACAGLAHAWRSADVR